MATKPGVYQQKKSQKWRYWDGKKWVGERYDTRQEAEANAPEPEPSGDDSTPTKRWPIILSIILVVLVALIVGGLVFINHQSAKEAQLEQQVQTEPDETAEAPEADSTQPAPEDWGDGISSEQKNNDGSSKILEYDDADFQSMDVFDDDIMNAGMAIAQEIADGKCQGLTEEYPTIQDISCPVSDYTSSDPEIGYMGYDSNLDAYRVNGAFNANGDEDTGGFVIIFNSDYQPVFISYMQPVPTD